MRVQELAHHWATKYDWRKHEAYLNKFPQFKLAVNGIDLHFVHLRSSDPDAVPLLLSHGWPGSFYGALVGLAVCSGAAAAAFCYHQRRKTCAKSGLIAEEGKVLYVLDLVNSVATCYIHISCLPAISIKSSSVRLPSTSLLSHANRCACAHKLPVNLHIFSLCTACLPRLC